MKQNIDLILEGQRKFFRSGETLSVEFRIEMLKKLYDTIKENKSRPLGKRISEKANLKASCVRPAWFCRKSPI